MKITLSQLRRIIKEEVSRVVRENDEYTGSEMHGLGPEKDVCSCGAELPPPEERVDPYLCDLCADSEEAYETNRGEWEPG